MEPRPWIAVVLKACIYATFQFFAYKLYGVPLLVGAWAIIIIATWVDVKPRTAQIAQTVVQSAWFIFVLGGIHMNQITI